MRHRTLTALFTGVAVLGLAVPTFASSATPKPMMKSHSMMAPSAKVTPAGNHTCPMGATYVKGYKKADGTKVKGYCRKA